MFRNYSQRRDTAVSVVNSVLLLDALSVTRTCVKGHLRSPQRTRSRRETGREAMGAGGRERGKERGREGEEERGREGGRQGEAGKIHYT